MSEPRGQLRKEHLTFPGCSHFRRLDDNHEKCQSCMYGGAPGCTRLSRCHFCADWTSSMWDAEEKNRQAAVKRRIRKKDKKASASSTGEPMRPGCESSSEVFSSRNPSPAHSRTSGYSGKGPSPKVHSRDETRVERGPSWRWRGEDWACSLSCQGPSSWGTGGAGSLPVTGVPWEDGAFLLSFSYTWSGEVPRGWHSPWLWWERPLGRFPQGIFRVQSWTQLWGWRVVGFATSPSSHTIPGG